MGTCNFSKGQNIFITSGINVCMAHHKYFAQEVLSATARFRQGDWGEICDDDKMQNDQALLEGGQIIASYPTSQGNIFVITENVMAEAPITTILFAYEY